MSFSEVSKEIKYQPLYEYVEAIKNLIPGLGHYPSPKKAREIARKKEKEIKKIINQRPNVGGRAG